MDVALDADRCERPECALFDTALPPQPDEHARDSSSTVANLWTEGDALYEAMLSGIATASHTVRLESFIFSDDAIGRRFAVALAARASSGVRVLLHVDALRVSIDRSYRLLSSLRSAGVELKLFGPFQITKPLAFLRRNHRKLLVIDDDTAFLGGFNIHRQSSRAEIGERRWRDTHVELKGSLAALASQVFDTMWNGRPTASFTDCARAINGEMIVADASRTCRHRLRCLFGAALAQATQSIYLTTPYFVPPRQIEDGLKAAARRGVDVRVLVPHQSNHPVALAAGRARYRPLLRSGVRIFAYRPRLLHAKTLVVDGKWTTIGTANIDYLSLFANHELNFVSNDTWLASTLVQCFLADLQDAGEITLPAWDTRSTMRSIVDRMAWYMRHWL